MQMCCVAKVFSLLVFNLGHNHTKFGHLYTLFSIVVLLVYFITSFAYMQNRLEG
jgi:hypothetical protein